MIKNLLGKFITDNFSERNPSENDNYKQAVEEQQKLFAKIKGALPKDKTSLIFDYDSSSNLVLSINEEETYKCGISDGIQLFKDFKRLQGYKVSIDAMQRLYEIDDAYKKEVLNVTGEEANKPILELINKYRPGNISEFMLFILRKAYEDGKKDGFEEALS